MKEKRKQRWKEGWLKVENEEAEGKEGLGKEKGGSEGKDEEVKER